MISYFEFLHHFLYYPSVYDTSSQVWNYLFSTTRGQPYDLSVQFTLVYFSITLIQIFGFQSRVQSFHLLFNSPPPIQIECFLQAVAIHITY